jgi:hypothetical protein
MADGRQQFFEHMRSAPYAAHQLVQAIHHRFDPRNDVEVHYTEMPDLRLRVVWENARCRDDEQNFARFEWQSKNEVFYCETYVPAEELAELGFEGAREHKHGPLLSQVRLASDCWEDGDRRDAFFRTLDLACVRMTQSR